MSEAIMNPRTFYMDQLFRALDSKNLIIMSGARHVGKSCIAMQLAEELEKSFADKENIIRFDYEKLPSAPATADELIAFLKERFVSAKMNYILLDEIIHIADWELAVNFFYRFDNCKIILIKQSFLSRHTVAGLVTHLKT